MLTHTTSQIDVQKTNLKQYEGLSAKVDAAVTKQLKESELVCAPVDAYC